MTLLLGTRESDSISLTADGLSLASGGSNQTDASNKTIKHPARTTLQKIFPIKHRPFAIVQSGENVVSRDNDKCSIASVLRAFCNESQGDTVAGVAGRLLDFISKYEAKEPGDLWIAGFSDGTPEDRWCHIEIPVAHDVSGCGNCSSSDVRFAAGCGKEFLPDDWTDQEKAYEIAVERQKQCGKFVFGGHRHVLEITNDGCHWVSEPKENTLGFADLFENDDTLECVDIPGGSEPRQIILEKMQHLKEELKKRAKLTNGNRPSSFKGCRDHWKSEPIDWDKVDIACVRGDAARGAESSEVSDDDARLYYLYVQSICNSLPAEADGG